MPVVGLGPGYLLGQRVVNKNTKKRGHCFFFIELENVLRSTNTQYYFVLWILCVQQMHKESKLWVIVRATAIGECVIISTHYSSRAVYSTEYVHPRFQTSVTVRLATVQSRKLEASH